MAQGRVSIHWWAYPSRVPALITLPIYVACWSLEPSAFVFYEHPRKFLEGAPAWLGFAAILGFAVSSFLLEPLNPRPVAAGRTTTEAVDTAIRALAGIVLAAYAIFMFPILLRPGLLIELLQGSPTAMFTLRETLNRIPG